MPVTWDLDLGRKRLVLTVTDPHTFEEWHQAVTEIFASEFGPGYTALVDRRHALPPSARAVERMARVYEVHKARLAGVRVATLVGTPVAYGMARMMAVYAEMWSGYELEIFQGYAEAEAWLERGRPSR